MLQRGVLAIVDAKKVAAAHVQVYEAMGCGACGRYFCFERVVRRLEDAIEVENGLNMHGLLSDSGGRQQLVLPEGLGDQEIDSNLDNSKLSKLILQASDQGLSCKQCCKFSWS